MLALNWVGSLIQNQIGKDDTVLDLGCGLMLDIMDFCSDYPKTRLQCKDLVGMDAYQPYLDYLNQRGIKTLNHDLRLNPLPFGDKSFDIVLLLDVIEHLDNIHQVDKLIAEAKRISRKSIFIVTPQKYDTKKFDPFRIDPTNLYHKFGTDNKLLYHHFAVTKEWFEGHRFHIIDVYGLRRKKEHYFAVYNNYETNSETRILHVWEQAGVNCLMAKYQIQLGNNVHIIMCNEFDSHCYFYGFIRKTVQIEPIPEGELSKRIFLKCPKFVRDWARTLRRKLPIFKFYFRVIEESKDYDILHINSVWQVCLLLPFKKKIVEFYGDDLRNSPSFSSPLKKLLTRTFVRFYTLFSPIYVSTEDLLDEGFKNAVWIPNPVDIEHFKPRDKYEPNTALYCKMWYEDPAPIIKMSNEKGWKLTIHDRKNNAWIPFEDMPTFLSPFEYYIDRYIIKSLSKTALEALSLGLKVVRYDGEIICGLDPIHDPTNVAKMTLDIYNKVLGKGGKK